MQLPSGFFLKGQTGHLAALIVLVGAVYAVSDLVIGDGVWLGITVTGWFWLTILIGIIHQVVTWAGWRSQLQWSLLTRWFGQLDLMIWGIIFLPLLAARPLTLIGLGIADFNSLPVAPELSMAAGIVLLIPGVYTLWSTARYFGIKRAMGGDHFRQKYREMPLVNQGAFAWSGNAMYVYGFLILWAIALLSNSLAAIAAAAFHHLYVWVHYFSTEKPDMELLYK